MQWTGMVCGGAAAVLTCMEGMQAQTATTERKEKTKIDRKGDAIVIPYLGLKSIKAVRGGCRE